MTAELFRLSLGLDLVHVPFNGAGPAVASTIGGHTPIAFGSPASSIAQVKDGKLRGLAVASGEAFAGATGPSHHGASRFCRYRSRVLDRNFCPGRHARLTIIALLNREIEKAVALPDVRQRLDALGFEPAAIKLADSTAKLRSESAKWAKVVQAAGIKVE